MIRYLEVAPCGYRREIRLVYWFDLTCPDDKWLHDALLRQSAIAAEHGDDWGCAPCGFAPDALHCSTHIWHPSTGWCLRGGPPLLYPRKPSTI
jgi:hypothetical protein